MITGPKLPEDNRSRNDGDNINTSGSRGKQSNPVTTSERTLESANIVLTNEHPHSAKQSGIGSRDPEGEFLHPRDHVRG